MMNREEAIQVIDNFVKQGGNLFIDGCKGNMPDKDLIFIAKNCLSMINRRTFYPEEIKMSAPGRKLWNKRGE